MDLSLKGKVVIVTGGARGIGESIVQGFSQEGANIVIGDVLFDMAQELAKKLTKRGTRVLVVKTDVSKKTDADNLATATIEEFGEIDILVNAAAIVRDALLVDIEEEEWDQVLDTNAKGTYLVTRAVVPHMIAARQGKVVNISSRSGKDAQAGLSHYGASKFAVIGFTQSLAKELASYNINVNAVCPGIIHTDMWERILDARSARTGIPREEIWARMIETIPLKRPQAAEDIASMVLFLSSDIARNITGEAIHINGEARMD